MTLPEEGRRRVIIENVQPELDGGRFAIKRTVHEKVIVEADICGDGHDLLSSVLKYRRDGGDWTEVAMEPMPNDRWRGEFTVENIGLYFYTLEGWVDRFACWQRDLEKKVAAGQEVSLEFLIGAQLIDEATKRAEGENSEKLRQYAKTLRARGREPCSDIVAGSLLREISRLMARYPDKRFSTHYDKELPVVVDREEARFSTWYEMFPRSSSAEPGRHGTFKDCEARLPYIQSMGFDVLYLPPIHPIGKTHKKGKNNTDAATPEDPGSPWAIGSEEGGHKSVSPSLGTLDDFKELLAKARERGIEVALDLAFQCSPDHPYVREHPEWFRRRPDGSIQYAENPPKKYQDIYPLDFETDAWRDLWQELKGVLLFWIEQGVRIFRVDNPHTKPFRFWAWILNEIKRDHPDVIFLSEAFTRPKVMYELARLGFSQSYTYFAWRNTRAEITEYLTELTQTEVREYFRMNLWPNTPDILTEYLQFGGRPAFMTRLVLAATLGASYGIYGPAFEFCENLPREPGSEEYLNSEKYEIRHWPIERPDTLRDYIARVNRIRRENPALQSDWSLRFHAADNDQIICYSKTTGDLANVILVVVNLDPHHKQSGWLHFSLEALGLGAGRSYQAHDLLSDARYIWQGPRNYVELDPRVTPAHIFRFRRRVRTEKDFDYFM
ncbi:MAG: alpha-1,4-glucan--maltose-1-phosphate maltosyltransferase [Deltaproteobacteria bacterium]|nr:alpha-1,4-glucan--maltose-1-phosphate maltosyltransferase [Deltaproteobacteria bacterium]